MCIAILNLTGKIDRDILQRCWNANKDGAGMAYLQNGKIQIFKVLNSFESFWNAYDKRRDKVTGPFMLHFRIKTHGLTNLDNCHPFKLSHNSAMCHNGIISNEATDGQLSDTRLFIQNVINGLPKSWLKNQSIIRLIEGYIGYSKLIILEGNKWHIINEDMGTWDDGNWFSNDSYKKPKVIHNSWQPVERNADICDICNYASYKARYYSDVNMALCSGCAAQYAGYIGKPDKKRYANRSLWD